MKKFKEVWQKIVHYPGAYYEEEAKEMYRLLMKLNKNSLVVELGCMYGRSSIVIGEVSKIKGFKFVCIDNFSVNGEDAKKQFKKHVLDVYPKCKLIEGNTDDIYKKWKKTIDYLFIDANHMPEGITADCKNWLPFVKRRGITQFHDYVGGSFPQLPVIVDKYTESWKEISRKDLSVFKRRYL